MKNRCWTDICAQWDSTVILKRQLLHQPRKLLGWHDFQWHLFWSPGRKSFRDLLCVWCVRDDIRTLCMSECMCVHACMHVRVRVCIHVGMHMWLCACMCVVHELTVTLHINYWSVEVMTEQERCDISLTAGCLANTPGILATREGTAQNHNLQTQEVKDSR